MKLLVFGLVLSSILPAQQASAPVQPVRPRVLGIAHFSIRVSDVARARAYYKDFLGFDEPFSLKNPDDSLSMAFIKVNDYQYIELSPGLRPEQDRLSHISFFTDDAEGMRVYLGSRGTKVPDRVPKGRSGNLNFNVKDPDGHTVEIVQYMADGWALRDKGKFVTDARISKHIGHMGVMVGDANAAIAFYGGILGFQETWRGSSNGTTLSWINMRVPDGSDYIEFMLYKDQPAPDQRGTVHHFCLETPNISEALETLKDRQHAFGYTRPLEIRTGTNRKRQLNVFDPDGTRMELMEPVTVDGSAPVPSTAPLPR
ncbi:MAG: VOC family protein [Candidatus Solibacter sp.]|nr:VOC family protein [Candidatus Solibacter sp.]